MAVGDAHVFPGFLIPVLIQLPFQSYQLLFSHASEVRCGKFASIRYQLSTVKGSICVSMTLKNAAVGNRMKKKQKMLVTICSNL